MNSCEKTIGKQVNVTMMTIGVGREGESLGSEYQEVQQGKSRAMTLAPQAFLVIIKFLVFVDVSFRPSSSPPATLRSSGAASLSSSSSDCCHKLANLRGQ